VSILCGTKKITKIKPEMKNRIKVYRALRNLTQEALADQLGVTRQTILAIEKEKYDPSLELAFRISGLFKVPIDKMFFYEKDGEDRPLFED
jgi:putative transcriptional regulator